ncbi:MAG: hypothetical protein ACYTGX_00625 [Planctomycetota bacterium]|jgi:hypothetical protein
MRIALGIALGVGTLLAPATAAAQAPQRATWRERIAPYRDEILALAKENAERPRVKTAPKARLTGDGLADLYLRRAAGLLRARTAELKQPEAIRSEVQTFCVSMGILLDRTGALATNPMARLALGDVETAEERAARRKILGDPTLRGRGDWLRHFWVSAALRALVGRAIAERAGVTKELADAKGTSGFSLADLCANVAGLELAERLLAPSRADDAVLDRLEAFARTPVHTRWMPEAKDLPEGLDAAEAARRYGSAGGDKMAKTLANLKALVRTAGGHRPAPTPVGESKR